MNAENLSEWSAEKRLEHYKAKAEACYRQMYDCKPYELKDFKDDAISNFYDAVAAVKELGLTAEVEILEKKIEQIMAVYRQLSL